ncbi:MAG: NAD(P)(+) transhydrogenase (Re/Si-specific) subunit beta [Bryobacterales bacterium]|nr:NAD(P)(+) transhydrogenase (Re/Si-specific) subunit beta [Bryobacterales bacterium]
MHTGWQFIVDAGVILLLLAGVSQFRALPSARRGNLAAALALLCGIAAVLFRNPPLEPGAVVIAVLAGSLAGWAVALRVDMVQIPAMVAFQHGAGGVAAFLVSFVELTRHAAALTGIARPAGILGLIVGAATFSGSMVASGKLAGRLASRPVVLRHHNALLLLLIGLMAALALTGGAGPVLWLSLLGLVLLSILLGVLFSARIGGADMPVLISFLNATAGAAAALCGILIQNRLLIACGATVAASGSLLTYFMCRAMNRSLVRVFAGSLPGAPAAQPAPEPVAPASGQDPFVRAAESLRDARSVIVVPGYGMAQAHAQLETVQLGEILARMGKQVRFAVHPVAGRMPGHMHVLLAEAGVDPDTLLDITEINSDFSSTDVALIVGACDVVNPAAITQPGTPISGMPILNAHEARHAVVCNLDRRPGYSGVENSLYAEPATIFLEGDAKVTLRRLFETLQPPASAA